MERHCRFIKYTALRGIITRSITDTVHVLIRDNETGTCIGGIVIEWYTKINQWGRHRIHKSEATNWCEKSSDDRHFVRTDWQLPKHFQIHVGRLQRGASRARGSCQSVRSRRSGVCIAMVWPWLQGIQMLIAAKIVVAFCHPPYTSHNLCFWFWRFFVSEINAT